jgi:hypothetical protein
VSGTAFNIIAGGLNAICIKNGTFSFIKNAPQIYDETTKTWLTNDSSVTLIANLGEEPKSFTDTMKSSIFAGTIDKDLAFASNEFSQREPAAKIMNPTASVITKIITAIKRGTIDIPPNQDRRIQSDARKKRAKRPKILSAMTQDNASIFLASAFLHKYAALTASPPIIPGNRIPTKELKSTRRRTRLKETENFFSESNNPSRIERRTKPKKTELQATTKINIE